MADDDYALEVHVDSEGVPALGPDGRGTRLGSGTYPGIEFDGVPEHLLYVRTGNLNEPMVCVQRSSVRVERVSRSRS